MDSYKLKIAFCHPKYWLAWLGIGTLFISSLLPYSTLIFIGKILGRTAMPFAKKRQHIARCNLIHSFPDLSEQEVEDKVRLNFENSGIALLEMGMAWFWPSWRVRGLLKVRGSEHVDKAIINGQGTIFLGAHFLTLEIGARALGLTRPCHAVYRKHSNPVLDYWFYWGRMREHKAMLDRRDFKGMLRVLKNKDALWYAPDHDYGKHKSSVFAPFFAVENVNTVSGTSTLAKVKDSCVIPVFLKRLPANEGYELIFYPALKDFPSKDLVADTHTTNQQIEKMVAECDDQYMWMHKRFKTRPEGEASFY
ncbi:LpxL/LpxP family Kdo(2)-lipid IV(A) lauroyl/palmitoleoyl acyltransferase [Psychromonas sp. KJ10-10]|uniref:LpxL/LpxP family Kdo(2)-lipid IV(A) lauroyl/palmitoleoyl acyltransferase n=1 Tax=Psychromonas sp. KJ10-10 TaxID=3391823 RepID=UPI0039B4B5EE